MEEMTKKRKRVFNGDDSGAFPFFQQQKLKSGNEKCDETVDGRFTLQPLSTASECDFWIIGKQDEHLNGAICERSELNFRADE